MNKEILPDIATLNTYMQMKRASAERKRNMLMNAAKAMGRSLTQAEIERAGHEDDKIADAYEMLVDQIMRRILIESSVKQDAANLKLIEIDETTKTVVEVQPAPKHTIAVPEIKDAKVKKEAEDMIQADEIEESIDEAARNGNWDIARSKVEHFFRGTDMLSTSPSEKEIDEIIRDVMKSQAEKRMKTYEEKIGLSRSVVPLGTPDAIAKTQYLKNNKFNIGIFISNNKEVSTEDRVKLTAIQLYTTGNEKAAINTIYVYYKEKEGWSEETAREFLMALMKKDPLKELNTVIKNLLEYNRDQKGDAKQGIKFCRSIVGAYFNKKYTITEKPTIEQQRDNKLIDRVINRQLKEVVGTK